MSEYTIWCVLRGTGWTQDEVGPFQAVPYPGGGWPPAGHPTHQEHAYIRDGTTKPLTLRHRTTGAVRVQG